MLNVTIQNDGKIKIQTECSNVKEMRHNVNLLLAVVSSMEMEEAAANKEANSIPVQSINYLYLDKVEDNNKLSTVDALSKQLNISLKEAKAIVDRAVDDKHNNILVASSADFDFINNVRNALESVGCICRITSGM
nr:MAG TPA: ribosomal protein L7/L12 [Caudoviricetes sp.]